jgi:hypothetical protein
VRGAESIPRAERYILPSCTVAMCTATERTARDDEQVVVPRRDAMHRHDGTVFGEVVWHRLAGV